MLTYERLATAIQDEAAAFIDTVDGADLAGQVPTCPEWTVGQLVHHVGRAFYWAAATVTSGATAMIP
ncbi:MAG TPA: maleylpyruvate isomerase N-terminal domain-containing protein, partial [Pseudonocardiaceae bacterium]